jgi:hypothetical protein
MARGTLVVPHGFTDPNVGHLTATDVDVDPLSGMPTLVGVPVSLQCMAGGEERSTAHAAPASGA